MDDWIFIFRGVERIVAVAIGGTAIYLGYRLFLSLPEQKDSDGRFLLPGGISIYLSRVGPGAFFALFGCVIVAISFAYSVNVDYSVRTSNGNQSLVRTDTHVDPNSGSEKTVSISSHGPPTSPSETTAHPRGHRD